MARPRTPTAIHLLKGTEQKHPDRMRARSSEPQPQGGVGPCPERLGPIVAQAWDYLVESCAPGVLTRMDRVHLEVTAVTLATWWVDPIGEGQKLTPVLAKLLSQMGMNPSDRSRVAVAKEAKRENPFKIMLGGRTGTSPTS